MRVGVISEVDDSNWTLDSKGSRKMCGEAHNIGVGGDAVIVVVTWIVLVVVTVVVRVAVGWIVVVTVLVTVDVLGFNAFVMVRVVVTVLVAVVGGLAAFVTTVTLLILVATAGMVVEGFKALDVEDVVRVLQLEDVFEGNSTLGFIELFK
jgi:hypothetical protein